MLNWEAEVRPNHDRRCLEALRLVSEFRTKAIDLRKTRMKPILRRVLQPDFPPELLIQVVEAYVWVQLLRWRVGPL